MPPRRKLPRILRTTCDLPGAPACLLAPVLIGVENRARIGCAGGRSSKTSTLFPRLVAQQLRGPTRKQSERAHPATEGAPELVAAKMWEAPSCSSKTSDQAAALSFWRSLSACTTIGSTNKKCPVYPGHANQRKTGKLLVFYAGIVTIGVQRRPAIRCPLWVISGH